jgi:surfeit locus 1 family protein
VKVLGSEFRPRLAPTLITLPLVLLCLGLGAWQVQRLHWKEGLIAQRQAASAAPPVTPPQDLADARSLEWRRVAAAGVLLNDKETLVHTIGPEGGAGFDVLTPLRQQDGSIVFIDRGFVPTALADPALRSAGEPRGEARVVGILRLSPAAKPSWFVPDNDPPHHSWFWVDLTAIAAAGRISDSTPYYIVADASPNPGGWPRGGQALPPLSNHHLQYALTWFSLAVAGVVIYVLSQRIPGDSDARTDERIPPT